MPEVRRVDFNALPAPVRTRLAASLSGRGQPRPLIVDRPARSTAAWVVLALMASAAAFFAGAAGFGTLGDSDGVQDWAWLFVYVLCFFFVFLSVLSLVRSGARRRSLPWPAGLYLLPLDVVDARQKVLRLVPTRALSDFKGVHQHTNGRYTHSTFTFSFGALGSETFTVRGQAAADAALTAFWESQRAVNEAAQAGDARALYELDPLYEVRASDGWNSLAPHANDTALPRATDVPLLLRRPALLSAPLALLVAVPVWGARNLWSDHALYTEAKARGTEEAHKQYVSEGLLHVDEARAALPHLALKEAKRAGTATALREVIKRYPGSVVVKDARAEIHRVFQKSWIAFNAKAPANDPRMHAFMESLLAHLEAHDSPSVQVRFRPPTLAALAQADRTVVRRAGGRPVAPIAPHFEDKTAAAREASIVTALDGGFTKIFPADVLKLRQGPRLRDDEASAAFADPTILVAYEVAPSGTLYESQNTQRLFVGMEMAFQVQMTVPQGPGYAFNMKVAPPDHFTVEYETGSPGSTSALLATITGPPDERVYLVMAARAFDQLGTRLSETFFKPAAAKIK